MTRNQETLAFAERLRQALTRSPRKMRTPSELALQFNLNHAGDQVTNQAAQKWLSGKSKPSPEKIETLAALCSVSVQWLRYGIPDTRSHAPASLSVSRDVKVAGNLLPDEAVLLGQFRLLSAHQQRLIADLVEQLALDKKMWCDLLPRAEE
jgi:transcriptional regulator with XRE-family HTH domain